MHVEAVPLRYDHDAFLAWFDGLWEATSPAAVSYRSRIVDGPDDRLEDSLLGASRAGRRHASRRRRGVRARRRRTSRPALAKLVYFEDVMDDDACLRTVDEPSTIQVNVGARCNLACAHCHVEAGPHRTEAMDRATFEAVLAVAARPGIETVDVTGGAPEMNPHFAWFIEQASRVARVMVRTNLVILRDPSYAPLVDRYAEAWAWRWWPRCRTSTPRRPSNSAATRRSIPPSRCCASCNARGYGRDGAHVLDLVFNPQWPVLPPCGTRTLDLDLYRRRLAELGVSFDHLFAVANNPIGRYGAHLVDTGEFDPYLDLLIDGFNQEACAGMMCRGQLSVGWDGRVYDCDFNQALGLPTRREDGGDRTIFDYAADPTLPLARAIRFRNHCYACTAGSGSSGGGTIVQG